MAICYNINFPQLIGLNDVILLTSYEGYLYFHKSGDFITNASRRKLFLKNGTAIYANLLHEVFEVLNFNNGECKNYDMENRDECIQYAFEKEIIQKSNLNIKTSQLNLLSRVKSRINAQRIWRIYFLVTYLDWFNKKI